MKTKFESHTWIQPFSGRRFESTKKKKWQSGIDFTSTRDVADPGPKSDDVRQLRLSDNSDVISFFKYEPKFGIWLHVDKIGRTDEVPVQCKSGPQRRKC